MISLIEAIVRPNWPSPLRSCPAALDAALLGFGAERCVDPARQLGYFVAGIAQRTARRRKIVLSSASLASASNGFGVDNTGMVAPSASGCGRCIRKRRGKIDRRIAQHGRADVGTWLEQPAVAVDADVQNYAVVQIFDRFHAADQQAVLADRRIRARRPALGASLMAMLVRLTAPRQPLVRHRAVERRQQPADDHRGKHDHAHPELHLSFVHDESR